MAEVFIAPTGALDRDSVADLRAAGIVVVETDEPERCQFIRSSEVLSADDMLWAALSALQVADGYGSDGKAQREALAKRLFQIVDRRVQAWQEPTPTPALKTLPAVERGDDEVAER